MPSEPYEYLEQLIGNWSGRGNVVACSSGTAALHLALEAFRLPQGSEVILPDYTMVSCARAVTLAGLKPVFIDSQASDLLINPCLIEEAITTKTRAIMAVHAYGRGCAMGAIMDVANKYDLHVIEDSAEAHGLPAYPGIDAVCWSFYKNKIVAGEEGGAVSFANPGDATHARKLRSVGFTDDHDYYHHPRGHNYRLANALAVPIMNSLAGFKMNVAARRCAEFKYDRLCPAEWRMPERDAPWVYDLRVKGMTQDQQREVVKGLQAMGVPARHGFKPMSHQAEYRTGGRWCNPVAGQAATEVIYLPLTGDYDDRIVELIFKQIKRLAG